MTSVSLECVTIVAHGVINLIFVENTVTQSPAEPQELSSHCLHRTSPFHESRLGDKNNTVGGWRYYFLPQPCVTHIKVDNRHICDPTFTGFDEEFSEKCLHFHVRDFQQTPAGTERL